MTIVFDHKDIVHNLMLQNGVYEMINDIIKPINASGIINPSSNCAICKNQVHDL
jgi:hypothetical protein